MISSSHDGSTRTSPTGSGLGALHAEATGVDDGQGGQVRGGEEHHESGGVAAAAGTRASHGQATETSLMRLKEYIHTTLARTPASSLPAFLGVLAEGQAMATTRLVAPPPTQPVRGDDLLTYGEAASYLRSSESYVETLVRQGTLPAVTLPGTAKGSGEHRRQRAGRGRRIKLSDLKRIVEG